ncbi:hypothetical protein [Cupriavidus sp. TMH.W2]|uniref:hypothetical protein n=1 Tax=Cupriavidus sp. TMH.W2 TaxID=3434465 RepID=UPI003D78519B
MALLKHACVYDAAIPFRANVRGDQIMRIGDAVKPEVKGLRGLQADESLRESIREVITRINMVVEAYERSKASRQDAPPQAQGERTGSHAGAHKPSEAEFKRDTGLSAARPGASTGENEAELSGSTTPANPTPPPVADDPFPERHAADPENPAYSADASVRNSRRAIANYAYCQGVVDERVRQQPWNADDVAASLERGERVRMRGAR